MTPTIKHMVDRFLMWKLPETFGPNGGIKFERVGNVGTSYEFRREPVGTNLLTATEAEAMVKHMLEGLPPAPGTSETDNQSLIAKLTDALEECGEYFDNRSDADFNTEEGFIPNKEMQLLSVVKEALAKAGRSA